MRLAVIVYVALAFLQRGVSFLLLPFVTRAMEPSEYGAASIVTAVGGLFALLLGGGLEQAVLRWSAPTRNPREARAILWIANLWLRLGVPLLTLIAAAALWMVPGQLLQVPNDVWALEVLATGLNASLTFLALPLLRASQKLRPYVILALLSTLSVLGGKVLFVIVWGLGVWGWAASDLAAAGVVYVAALAVTTPRGTVTRGDLRIVLRYAAPLIPHLVAFWALGALTRPLMSVSLTLTEVGEYSAAYNLASIGTLVVAEINRALVVRYAHDDPDRVSSATLLTARLQILAALAVPALIASGVYLLGPIVLPPSYAAAVPLVGILALLALPYGVYVVPMNFLTQWAGKTHQSWLASAVGATVIFSLTNIAALGGNSVVAMVNVVGYAAMAFAAFAIARREGLEVPWRRTLPEGRAVVVLGGLLLVSCGLTAFCEPTVPNLIFAAALTVASLLGAALFGFREARRLESG